MNHRQYVAGLCENDIFNFFDRRTRLGQFQEQSSLWILVRRLLSLEVVNTQRCGEMCLRNSNGGLEESQKMPHLPVFALKLIFLK